MSRGGRWQTEERSGRRPAGPLTPPARACCCPDNLQLHSKRLIPALPPGMVSPRGRASVNKPEVLLHPLHLHLHPDHLPAAIQPGHRGAVFSGAGKPEGGGLPRGVQSDAVSRQGGCSSRFSPGPRVNLPSSTVATAAAAETVCPALGPRPSSSFSSQGQGRRLDGGRTGDPVAG